MKNRKLYFRNGSSRWLFMGKKLFAIVLFLFCSVLLQASLLDFYKKNPEIKLICDSGFGKHTNWDELLYADISGIAFCQDGSFFVSARKQHKIFKFSKTGELLTSFGQKGQGPADLFHAGDLSILDNKYLVVGEYASNRRISIFDLMGKFQKLVRTNYSVFDVVALKSNKIAILSKTSVEKSLLKGNVYIKVYIKDIDSGKERIIVSETDKFEWAKQKDVFIALPSLFKEVFIKRTISGNLLLGINYSNIISIYSPAGERIKSIDLNIKPTKVTGKIIRKHKVDFINTSRERKWNNERHLKAFESFNSYDRFFSKHLPFYNSAIIDGEGNILVFHYTGCFDTNSPGFQVYSPKGDYICDSRLNFGIFRAPFVDSSFLGKIAIRSDGLYGLFEPDSEGGEDTYKQLIKVKFK